VGAGIYLGSIIPGKVLNAKKEYDDGTSYIYAITLMKF
jgi:hypothetical protein